MKYIISLILIMPSAFGASLKDYDYYNYDVFFTNPNCKAYELDKPIYSFAGNVLRAKPENVYCKYNDSKKNQRRKSSPHYNIKKLITNKNVKSLSMAYLSFSNSDILKTLCKKTIGENNTKLSLIVDKGSKADPRKLEKLTTLTNCKPAQKFIDAGIANYPEVIYRGQSGGFGYAHNKIIMAKYKNTPDKVTIVFSSANMSSGTTLHHENWHFVTTSMSTYFAQVHGCILNGMKDYTKSIRSNRRLNRKALKGIDNFKKYIKECRSKISVEEESDIKVSIIPSDGEFAMKRIVKTIKASKRISIAVHRFSHKSLRAALKKAGRNKKQVVRFVADDDIFWAGKVNEMNNGEIVCNKRNPNFLDRVGANMCSEYFNTQAMSRSGVKVKYMETNQSLFLLHHNKYIVFEGIDGVKGNDAIHCGAGNFTKAAFSKNFENYYFITIPEVVKTFKEQYDHVWNDLATSEKDLPVTQTLP